MHIFDTLSGRKEGLKKTEKKIKFFVCGPTVYDEAHIGHARTYVIFDSIIRFLRSQKWNIFYLQNITDVDDKIIKRAEEAGVPPKALALKFTRSYLSDMKRLGVTSVNKYASATKFIPQIVKQVKTLIDKGYAYKTSDGYYFDISKFRDYGKLSRRSAEQAESSVSRIDDGTDKRNKGDFCLWKFRKGSEPFWKTELGEGRPGWHIEDTAISEYFFGPQYDIHGGGVDLKFPHHEAEITQQEAASGLAPFVKIWMHTGLLFVDGAKMSKSLNNFVTIKEFLSRNSARVFRFMALLHHYRSNMNYTPALIEQAKQSLETIDDFLAKLDFVAGKSVRKKGDGTYEKAAWEAQKKFIEAMNDDFNTPAALAAIFEFMASLNKSLFHVPGPEAKKIKELMRTMLNSLGLEVKSNPISLGAKLLVSRRDKFRINKQFIQSDALRKKLESLGYKTDDTPLGTFVRRK